MPTQAPVTEATPEFATPAKPAAKRQSLRKRCNKQVQKKLSTVPESHSQPNDDENIKPPAIAAAPTMPIPNNLVHSSKHSPEVFGTPETMRRARAIIKSIQRLEPEHFDPACLPSTSASFEEPSESPLKEAASKPEEVETPHILDNRKTAAATTESQVLPKPAKKKSVDIPAPITVPKFTLPPEKRPPPKLTKETKADMSVSISPG